MPIREELFTHKIACPMGASLEDQAIVARWQFLRDYCFADQARAEKWQLMLKLAARRPLEKCNAFICSLTTINADTSFGINEAEFYAQQYPEYHHALDDDAQNDEFDALIKAYPWLNDDRYSGSEARHILYNLKISFDDNGESGLDRLQFYHDHHRLSALIEYIKEGRLSITEVAQYDKFESDKIPPRMLPRLLAGDLDEGITLTKDQIVAYDLHDYDPKNNPHRHELLTKEAFRQIHPTGDKTNHSEAYTEYTRTHTKDEWYLTTYFDTVLKPVVTERARLYLDLQKLKKQEEELSQGPLTWPQWLYYCFYKTPTQECKLVSSKIALFSGAIEGLQHAIHGEQNKIDDWRKTEERTKLITYSYIWGNFYSDRHILYANANYLKENFGCNAIESTQFSILNRDYSISSPLFKYTPHLKPNRCFAVRMLTEGDVEPTSCAKDIINIKISQANPEKACVYWAEGKTVVKKTFNASTFSELLPYLPKPSKYSTDNNLCQRISTICDYSIKDRWLTLEEPTINYARDYVASFFKGLIGTLFCVPAGIIGIACPSFANSFGTTFFGTHSFNCLKKAEASREKLYKQMWSQ